MARKLTIEIIGKDWYIEASNTDGKSIGYFANSVAYENKIVYLHDYLVVDITDDILNDERFKEQCEFKYNDKSFEGTFIDALKYIQKEFNNG